MYYFTGRVRVNRTSCSALRDSVLLSFVVLYSTQYTRLHVVLGQPEISGAHGNGSPVRHFVYSPPTLADIRDSCGPRNRSGGRNVKGCSEVK